MSVFATIVQIVSFASAASLLAALVASVLRRWHPAATMSRLVVLLGPTVLVACAIGFIAWPLAFSPRDSVASTKAVVLSLGVSEALNCGAVAYLAFLPGVVVWVVARWRFRATDRVG